MLIRACTLSDLRKSVPGCGLGLFNIFFRFSGIPDAHGRTIYD